MNVKSKNVTYISKEEHSSCVDSDPGYGSQSFEEENDRCDDSTGFQPGIEDYCGPLNFQLFLNTEGKSKKSWLYSTILKKLYIDINRVVCVQFKYNKAAGSGGKERLMLRALPVYADPESLQDPVHRCPVHIMADKANGMPWVHHVLRAEHHEAEYLVNKKSNRYSVIVPVSSPTIGSEFVTIMYRFTCKTSCALGLSRRPIYVIFTLETSTGTILGRRKLLVKVCSCPKRDLRRDETVSALDLEEGCRKKRKEPDSVTVDSGGSEQSEEYSYPSKEIRLENDDDDDDENSSEQYVLPSFRIGGKREYVSTLELLHGHFLGLSVRNGTLIDMHPNISLISELLEKVKAEG